MWRGLAVVLDCVKGVRDENTGVRLVVVVVVRDAGFVLFCCRLVTDVGEETALPIVCVCMNAYAVFFFFCVCVCMRRICVERHKKMNEWNECKKEEKKKKKTKKQGK